MAILGPTGTLCTTVHVPPSVYSSGRGTPNNPIGSRPDTPVYFNLGSSNVGYESFTVTRTKTYEPLVQENGMPLLTNPDPTGGAITSSITTIQVGFEPTSQYLNLTGIKNGLILFYEDEFKIVFKIRSNYVLAVPHSQEIELDTYDAPFNKGGYNPVYQALSRKHKKYNTYEVYTVPALREAAVLTITRTGRNGGISGQIKGTRNGCNYSNSGTSTVSGSVNTFYLDPQSNYQVTVSPGADVNYTISSNSSGTIRNSVNITITTT